MAFSGCRAADAQSAYVTTSRVTSPQTAPGNGNQLLTKASDDHGIDGACLEGRLLSPAVTPT